MRKYRNMQKTVSSLLAIIITISALTLSVNAQVLPTSSSTDIVYVIDVSGSIDNTDPYQYARNALRLGVDLAPNNSRIGIVSVSDRVVSGFPLTDVSNAENRASAKSYIRSLYTNGNTDFLPGFQRALEMLASSTAENKRIIFLGDFQEGGFNLYTSESAAAGDIAIFSNSAIAQGVQIDLLLIEQAPANSITASQYTAMPGLTGGSLYELSSPNRFAVSVEDVYFTNFDYFHTLYALRGETAQMLQIPMPTAQVRRARIYVSAANPAASFGATYAGAALDGETTSSYAIIDLEQPSQEGIQVTVAPGTTGAANIYLMLEYDISLSVSYSYEHELHDGDKEYTQYTTVTAEVVDAQSGAPLATEPFADNVSYAVSVIAPDGQIFNDYEMVNETTLRFAFFEEEDFGTYEISAVLTAGDFTFAPTSQYIRLAYPNAKQWRRATVLFILLAVTTANTGSSMGPIRICAT